MKVWSTWPHIPSGIPRTREARERKLAAVTADLRRPYTPTEDAEDRRRVAEQAARDMGLGGLFKQ